MGAAPPSGGTMKEIYNYDPECRFSGEGIKNMTEEEYKQWFDSLSDVKKEMLSISIQELGNAITDFINTFKECLIEAADTIVNLNDSVMGRLKDGTEDSNRFD